jgi:hypothetical protein
MSDRVQLMGTSAVRMEILKSLPYAEEVVRILKMFEEKTRGANLISRGAHCARPRPLATAHRGSPTRGNRRDTGARPKKYRGGYRGTSKVPGRPSINKSTAPFNS